MHLIQSCVTGSVCREYCGQGPGLVDSAPSDGGRFMSKLHNVASHTGDLAAGQDFSMLVAAS